MRGSALALAAAVLIAGCGSSTGPSAPATPAPPSTPTSAIADTPATTATSRRVDGPLATVRPGTYEVGTGDGQIAPGKYFSPGPSGGATCYYARLHSVDGEADDIIADELSHGQIIMTVRASDGYVEVSGCTFIAAS